MMNRISCRIVSLLCIAALIVTSFGFSLGLPRANAAVEELTLIPTEDAYTRSGGYANTNYGNEAVLTVKDEESADGLRRAYLKYGLDGVSGSVSKATLRLCAVTVGFDLDRDVNIYSTDDSWSETGVKWSNMPAGVDLLGSLAITNPTPGCSHSGVYRDHEHTDIPPQWYELDVTDYINGQLSDKTASFLLMIEDKSYGSNVNFGSSEAVEEKRPQLVIETDAESDPEPEPEPDPDPEVITPEIVNPKEDTYIAGGVTTNPNPYHQEQKLEVRTNNENSNNRRTYLKFDISDFDKNLESAKLRLCATTIGATDTRLVEIGGVANTWSASAAAWSGTNAPPSAKSSSVKITEITVTNDAGAEWTGEKWFEADVSSYVRSHLSDDEVSFVVWINETNPANVNGKADGNYVYFKSSEAAAGKPELVLTPRAERYECETLPSSASDGDIEVTTADVITTGFTGTDNYLDFIVDVPDAGVYTVYVRNKNDSDRGIYQLSVDGGDVGSPVDQYADAVSYSEEELGKIIIEEPGAKLFRFTITGQNPESSGYNLGFDYIRLSKAQLDKVESVTADPPAGQLEGPTAITLTTATAGAEIYYKINAGTEWILYTEPIMVENMTTITAYAKKSFMEDSDSAKFTYLFPIEEDIEIVKADSPIILDGTVEADGSGNPAGEWAGAELVKIAGVIDDAGVHGADVFLKYDYENLYVGAKIKDPTPMVNTKTMSGIWNGDCLEIFIGDEDLDFSEYPTNGMAPSDRQIVFSGGTTSGYQSYLHIGGVTAYPPMLMSVEMDEDGKGYTIEAAIPLDILGFEKPWQNDGTETILSVVLNDGAAAGRGQWGWTTNGETVKKSRGEWGRAAFAAASDPEAEISLSAAVDDETQQVTVTGRTLHTQNKFVAMTVKDPDGEISTFDQKLSDANGEFTFTYNLNNEDASGDGVYTVLVGGEDIKVPVETSFSYYYSEQEENHDFTVAPVQFTDFSGNPVTALTASSFIMANVTITNNLETSAQASMIVALYDENDHLGNISVVEKVMAAGETAQMKAGFNLPDDVDNKRIRVFVWDSLGGMQALSDVVIFPND